MKQIKITLIMMIFFLFFTLPSYSADIAKIGVVNFQKIISESLAGKEAKDEIRTQATKMERDLKGKELSLANLKKKLEAEVLVMTDPKSREEKEREFQIKLYDFKKLAEKYQMETRQLERKLLFKLRKTLITIIDKIGKKEGYMLVLDGSVAVYTPSSNDITDKVIKQFNKVFKKK